MMLRNLHYSNDGEFGANSISVAAWVDVYWWADWGQPYQNSSFPLTSACHWNSTSCFVGDNHFRNWEKRLREVQGDLRPRSLLLHRCSCHRHLQIHHHDRVYDDVYWILVSLCSEYQQLDLGEDGYAVCVCVCVWWGGWDWNSNNV